MLAVRMKVNSSKVWHSPQKMHRIGEHYGSLGQVPFLGACTFAASIRGWIEFDNEIVKHVNSASFYFARH
jgi:hypothetical protein